MLVDCVSFRYFFCEINEIAETILNVPQLHVVAKPPPIQIDIFTKHPGKRLYQTSVQISLDDRAVHDPGRIVLVIGNYV